MGLELIEARPDQAYLYFNVACCESRAGRTDDAIEHLGRAIQMWDGCRELARQDSDFDPIRDDGLAVRPRQLPRSGRAAAGVVPRGGRGGRVHVPGASRRHRII